LQTAYQELKAFGLPPSADVLQIKTIEVANVDAEGILQQREARRTAPITEDWFRRSCSNAPIAYVDSLQRLLLRDTELWIAEAVITGILHGRYEDR
jgi:hypothetical protein